MAKKKVSAALEPQPPTEAKHIWNPQVGDDVTFTDGEVTRAGFVSAGEHEGAFEVISEGNPFVVTRDNLTLISPASDDTDDTDDTDVVTTQKIFVPKEPQPQPITGVRARMLARAKERHERREARKQ